MIDPITGAAIIGGAATLIGGNQSNQTNAKQARLNREFQERMSSTAYQRGVADIRAAGLNPGIAYGHGGASTPGGATAAPAQNNLGGAVTNAIAASQAKANIALTQAHTAKADAEARAAVLDTRFFETFQGREFAARLQEIDRRLQEGRRGAQIHSPGEFLDQQAAADLKLSQTHARQGAANARLTELGTPAAEAQNRVDRTKYGQYVRPFINDAKSAASIAGSAFIGGAVGSVSRNIKKLSQTKKGRETPQEMNERFRDEWNRGYKPPQGR